jgi:hypothetical protein
MSETTGPGRRLASAGDSCGTGPENWTDGHTPKPAQSSAQVIPNGDWGNFVPLGGTAIQQIVVANNVDGRLEVFGLGGNRHVYHDWQLAVNGDWNGWRTLGDGGTDLRALDIDTNADDRLELFVLGGDGAA